MIGVTDLIAGIFKPAAEIDVITIIGAWIKRNV